MTKNDYTETTYCDSLGIEIKAFFDRKNCDILRDNSFEGIILQGMEYRPDKVAAYYLGGSNYSWMIDYANDFTEGIKDYYVGRKIKIPNIDTVYALLKLS